MTFNVKQFLVAVLSAGLCVLSALGAACAVFNGLLFVPPLLYTAATIFIFLLNGVRLHLLNVVGYILAMFVAYVLVYSCTIFGMEIPFSGIATCGFGAVMSFYLVRYFIIKISFSDWAVFLAGGIAFLLGDILHGYIDTSTAGKQSVYRETANEYIPAFFTWQLIVGLYFFLTLKKGEEKSEPRLPKDYWFRSQA